MKTLPRYGSETEIRLRELLGTPHEDKFLPLCVDGIRALLDRWDHFKNNTIIAKRFLDELLNHFRACRPFGEIPDSGISDYTLPIVECLANIFKEDHLRQPTRQTPPAQANLMRFFEECGEWHKDDGKIATDYYYFTIPSNIKNVYTEYLVRRLTNILPKFWAFRKTFLFRL
jgi:hypothetical protein